MLTTMPLKKRHRERMFRPPHIGFTWKEWSQIVLVATGITVAGLFAIAISVAS